MCFCSGYPAKDVISQERPQKEGVTEKFSTQRQMTILIKKRVQGVTSSNKSSFNAQNVMAELQPVVQLDADVNDDGA